jgi:hypothetical protein
MNESIVKDWIRQVRPLFPKHARIEMDGGSDIALRIDWELRNDPRRPHKRSRVIRIVIPEEVIEPSADLKAAGSRLVGIIKDKLCAFDADHATPKCGRRPVEQWVISPHDLITSR